MKAFEEVSVLDIKKDNIIEGIMKSRGLYCLVSNAKVGKSMFAIQLSYALATGKQFLGHNVVPSPVLYISTESDFGQLHERAKILEIEFPKSTFYIVDRQGKNEVSIFDFEKDINDFATNHKGKLVIMDMLKDINLGIDYDINSYQDVGQKLLPKLRCLCDKYNVSILFTHHLNKKGKVLGSTAFDAVVDGKITLIENKNDKSLIRLNMINRDFPEIDIQLKKSVNQVFSVIELVPDEEIDFNLIQIIKYVSNVTDCKFTCREIINKLNLNITPKRLGKLLSSKQELLLNEGVSYTKKRLSSERLYIVHYEEPIDDNN